MIDGIQSARLKLLRASEDIKTIKSIVGTYAASEPWRIVVEPNGKERITVTHNPPADISILGGEVLYQVRSALDHLAFSLIKANPNGITLHPGWEANCAFPLKHLLPKSIQNPPVPYGHKSFSTCLPGIANAPFTFIERQQPYYKSGINNTALRILSVLSNIDKHRHLNLTVTRIRKKEEILFDSGAEHGSWHILNNEAELESVIGTDYPMGRAVKMERSFTPFVTFDESALGDAGTMPVEVALILCAYTVDTVILPTLETFIQKP